MKIVQKLHAKKYKIKLRKLVEFVVEVLKTVTMETATF
jgi:hypothetical protein